MKLARQGFTSRLFFALVPKRLLIGWVLRSIVHDPSAVTGAQIEGYAEPLRSASHRLALIKTALSIVPSDLDEFTARFPEIDVPTLLLWGRHDEVVPLSVGERLLEALPRASLVVLENCGHLPPEELPKESLEIVESFLRGEVSDAPSRG